MPLSLHAIVVVLAVCSQALDAQVIKASDSTTVSGQIVSRGIPVKGAEIRVRGSSVETVTDSTGRFTLRGLRPGAVVVEVRRLGFVAQDFPMTISAGEDRRVALELAPVPQTLPRVSVTSPFEKPARLAYTQKFDEFYARRAHKIGTFITREQIDSAFKSTTPELLQTIPGVFIRQEITQWRIQFPRCGGARLPGKITRGGLAQTEFVAVFVDGQYIPESTDELSAINPAQIEAIEIYKGPSELPADARGRGCGAIYLWLRNGR
jgi:carboxypeptidase family protein/TonB-dependent receptor-like protein